MALSRVVSEIFNLEKCRYVEIGGQRSLKVIESGNTRQIVYHHTLLVFFSNFLLFEIKNAVS